MKLDVYKHESRYKRWKEYVQESGADDLTKQNSETLLAYIFDMEIGANVSRKAKKGARSYPRLNNLRQRMSQMMRVLQKDGIDDIRCLTEAKVMSYFNALRSGEILTERGKKYRSVQDYAKVFKSFWHWHMKVERKSGNRIIDITEDLDTSKDNKPPFVYITKRQLYEEYLPFFNKNEQMVLSFVFDSIIRSPTELLSLQVNEIFERDNEVWVNVPDEIAKVKGRQFNLLYSGNELREYISSNKLTANDYLFNFSPFSFNTKMKKVAKQIWGEAVSHPSAKGKYTEITLYDLRHSGAIHLRKLAQEHPEALNLDTLRERGGWKDFKMLNYYTEFIGLSGRIQRGKLLLKEDKDELEKEVALLREEVQKFRANDEMLNELLNDPTVLAKLAQRVVQGGYVEKLVKAT